MCIDSDVLVQEAYNHTQLVWYWEEVSGIKADIDPTKQTMEVNIES